jgi:hypothetical protein
MLFISDNSYVVRLFMPSCLVCLFYNCLEVTSHRFANNNKIF